MHIVYRGLRCAYEAARWLSDHEGGACRSPVVEHDTALQLQGTEVYLWGIERAPEKLCLLKLNGFEITVTGLWIPTFARTALCFLTVRSDFNIAQDQNDIEEIHCRLIDGHIGNRSEYAPLGRLIPPYATQL